MTYIERKLKIIEYLNAHDGACSTDILEQKIFVSRSTLRRDLISMQQEGILIRHHGSVSLACDSSTEYSVAIRKMKNPEKKSVISKIASKYLCDNMVIFFDSSSTVSYLIPAIKNLKNITVITNGINIASKLNNLNNVKCFICPGFIKHQSLSIVGEYATNFLYNFRANIVFFSCKSINKHGIFEGDDLQAIIKSTMIKNSNKKILLCDSSKSLSTGFFKLSNFNDIDVVISDSEFNDEVNSAIEKSHCEFLYPNKFNKK